MLIQIHDELSTRKVLLVGHSQGTFYTNELYKYLTTHGVPKESIGVYNIATPASYVAGGGEYITSGNDKVINWVRGLEIEGNIEAYTNSDYLVAGPVASALRANIVIPKEDGWATDKFGGHHFSLYLNGATERVVQDIKRELSQLKASSRPGDSQECFVAPSQDLAYKTQQALFATGDALATASSNALSAPVNGALALVQGSRGIFADALASVLGSIASAFGPQANNAEAALVALSLGQTADTASAQKPAPTTALPVQTHGVSAPPVQAPQQSTTPSAPQNQVTLPSSSIQASGEKHFVQLPDSPSGGGAVTVSSASAAPANTQLAVTIPSDGDKFATSSVVFSGIADAHAEIDASYGALSASTTADGVGVWNFALKLPEGNTVITFTRGTVQQQVTVTIDTIPPAVSIISIDECSASLASSYCLIPVTSASVTWSDVADASGYALAVNGVPGTVSTATSTSASLTSNATTSLAVVAYDDVGNAATSSAISVGVVSEPLIINEIGWGGDSTSPSDQWIELKNSSGISLDLSHVALSYGGSTDLALSGTLPGTGNPFMLVEPFDIPYTGSQKVITSFSLSTSSAQKLALKWNGATIDQTPEVTTCSGWCAGSYSAQLGTNIEGNPDLFVPLSMERKSSASDGSLASSWHSTDSYGPWLTGGTAASWGTPAAENSFDLPEYGAYCGSPDSRVSANATYHPADASCVVLSRFITGGGTGVDRFAALYRGDVSSSTSVNGSGTTKALAQFFNQIIPSDAQAGDHFFFAIWEQRNGPVFNSENTIFNTFFTTGSTTAPHGQYVTIPWTYQ